MFRFWEIYCCFSLHYIKSVPAWFLSAPCRTAECCCWFLLDSLGRTTWVGTALKGGFSVLKASLAILERVYYYLTGVLCIFPFHAVVADAVRDFRHTIHLFSVSLRKSVYHRSQDKKAFQQELWPGIQPTVYTVGLIDKWHHRLLIFLIVRLGC